MLLEHAEFLNSKIWRGWEFRQESRNWFSTKQVHYQRPTLFRVIRFHSKYISPYSIGLCTKKEDLCCVELHRDLALSHAQYFLEILDKRLLVLEEFIPRHLLTSMTLKSFDKLRCM